MTKTRPAFWPFVSWLCLDFGLWIFIFAIIGRHHHEAFAARVSFPRVFRTDSVICRAQARVPMSRAARLVNVSVWAFMTYGHAWAGMQENNTGQVLKILETHTSASSHFVFFTREKERERESVCVCVFVRVCEQRWFPTVPRKTCTDIS
jgi:hypothetical protein